MSISIQPANTDQLFETNIQRSHDLYEHFDRLMLGNDVNFSELERDINDPTLIPDPIGIKDFLTGLAQLATTSVVETSEIVEAIHREIILRPIGRFNKRQITLWQYGLTGRLYNTLRKLTLIVGNSLYTGIGDYPYTPIPKKPQPLPDTLKMFVNTMNGVMGDHLVSHNNPLALPMRFYNCYGKPYYHKASALVGSEERRQRQTANASSTELSGRVIVLTHGLCMSYLHWQPGKTTGLAQKIIRDNPQVKVLHLDYNTGQRISTNGRAYAKLLQDLVTHNPNITQIDLIGHSMGGLVCRSALFYGKLTGAEWVNRVQKLVTIGTPHQGALLERIGSLVQESLSKLPFAGSIAKLGDIRSAGIVDLRHGSIRDEDWKALETRSMLPDSFRHPTELPADIHTYFIAGTLMENLYGFKASHVLGDGLVTVESALGEHAEEHALFVPEGHKAVFYGMHHQQLIHDDKVHRKIIQWLNDDGSMALDSRYYSYSEDFDIVL